MSDIFLNHVVVENILSVNECELLITFLNSNFLEGKTESAPDDVRVVDISTTSIPLPFLDRIAKTVANINKQYYNFNLVGFQPYDPVLMFKYSAENKSHYNWHNDFVYDETSTRKLSFSIQLSDPSTYDGGSLKFIPDGNGDYANRGSIIVFPSYIAHQITPVTRGTRYCIVGWVHGPAFK